MRTAEPRILALRSPCVHVGARACARVRECVRASVRACGACAAICLCCIAAQGEDPQQFQRKLNTLIKMDSAGFAQKLTEATAAAQ